MSAECDKHGTDIVYPPGTWPLGVCPECEHELTEKALRDENEILKARIKQLEADRD